MVYITEKAAGLIKEVMEEENKSDWYLRVYVADVGCGGVQFGLDLEEVEKEGDVVEENFGVKVICEKDLNEELNGMEIDYITTEFGEGFVIKEKEQ
jgi:iron-sulfur cluster assembly accessory protein